MNLHIQMKKILLVIFVTSLTVSVVWVLGIFSLLLPLLSFVVVYHHFVLEAHQGIYTLELFVVELKT